MVQVFVSNRISTSGIELSEMQGQIKEYKTENYVLSEKLLTETSLVNIASVAAQIGFVEVKSKIYLSTPLPLAKQ